MDRNSIKVLIVAHSVNGSVSPFVSEQAESLRRAGCVTEIFPLRGRGASGYLRNLRPLRNAIHEFRPDLVHAHYGLTALLANMQRLCPVVSTYHGSDVHSSGFIRFLSRISMRLSSYNIFVSDDLYRLSRYRGADAAVIPCGIDMELFRPVDRLLARERMGIPASCRLVLFAGAFDRLVKNPALALETMKMVPGAELKELKGYTREEMSLLMNASDCLLMTSFREGSPMVIKEALAVGLPIVSVDVGDVAGSISGIDGCFLSIGSPQDLADNVKRALSFGKRTAGRERLCSMGLPIDRISERIIGVYRSVLSSQL